jgi:hypothetical protein
MKRPHPSPMQALAESDHSTGPSLDVLPKVKTQSTKYIITRKEHFFADVYPMCHMYTFGHLIQI